MWSWCEVLCRTTSQGAICTTSSHIVRGQLGRNKEFVWKVMLIRVFWQNLHNRSSIICEWYYRKSRPGRICFWENWNSEKNVVQNPSKTPEMHNTSRQLHKLNYTIKPTSFNVRNSWVFLTLNSGFFRTFQHFILYNAISPAKAQCAAVTGDAR